jgi:tRNA pseudouridine38-40 synthase
VANIKLIVEYDGAGFHGWQKQPELRTVQGELEKAIATVLRSPISPLHAAGRTDAGVHARGQVVTFKVDADVDLFRLSQGVSHLLKGEISVISAEVVPDDFHPGWNSTRKLYAYRILVRPTPAVLDARRVWHISQQMDLGVLKRCAQVVVGTHDFSSFRDSTCTATSTVKTIFSSDFSLEGDILVYRVIGDGFLKQMVRNLVGTMTDIARGRIRDRTMEEILAAKDRRLAGVTAPAHGLCMEWVSYDPIPHGSGAPRDNEA